MTGAYASTTYTDNAKRSFKAVIQDRGTVWESGYDQPGRRNRSRDPDCGTATRTFDKPGRPLTATDEKRQTPA